MDPDHSNSVTSILIILPGKLIINDKSFSIYDQNVYSEDIISCGKQRLQVPFFVPEL